MAYNSLEKGGKFAKNNYMPSFFRAWRNGEKKSPRTL